MKKLLRSMILSVFILPISFVLVACGEFTNTLEGITANNVSVNYDGKAHSITINGTQSGDSIWYATEESLQGLTMPETIEEVSKIAKERQLEVNPSFTEVGKYGVCWGVLRGNQYAYGISSVEIKAVADSAKVLNITINGVANAQFTYTGNQITPDITVIAGSVTLATTDYEVVYANNIQVGTATITVTGKNNYINYSGSLSFTITNATITGITAEDVSVAYDGAEHTIIVAGTFTGDVVKYSLQNDKTTATTTAPTFKNVCEETTVYYWVERANCNDFAGSATVEIIKGTITGITAENVKVAYDGTEHSITVVGTITGDVVKYNLQNDKASATTTAPTFEEVCQGTTVYYWVERANYNDFAGSATVEIIKGTITGITAENVKVAYDGTEHSITVVGTVTGDVVKYNLQNDKASATTTAPTFEEVCQGTTVYYWVERANYNDFAGSATVEIIKGTITGITAENVKVVYDGTEHSITVVGTITGDVVKYNLQNDKASATTTAPTFEEVCQGTTVYYWVERANYNDFAGSATVEITLETIKGVTVGDIDLTYDGTEHSITVAGTIAGDVIKYNLQNNKASATTTAPTFKNVCDKVVYIWVERENYAVLDLTCDVKISPLETTFIIVIENQDQLIQDYTGQELTLDFEVKISLNNSNIILTKDVDYIITYNNNINAGNTAKAVVSAKAGGNFEGSENVEQTFVINKITAPEYTTPNIPSSMKTGVLLGTINLPQGWAWSNGNTAETAIGLGENDYYLTFTPQDTINYKTVENVKFTIKGCNPVEGVSASSVNVYYDGYSHSISVTGLVANDVVVYSLTNDKNTATSTNPDYINVVDKTIYYWVSRVGFDDFASSAQLKIKPIDTTLNVAIVGETTLSYNGSEQTPAVVVKTIVGNTETTLVLDQDYTLAYENNKNVSTNTAPAKIKVTGKGNFLGSTGLATFDIVQADKSGLPTNYTKDSPYTIEWNPNLNLSQIDFDIDGFDWGNYVNDPVKPGLYKYSGNFISSDPGYKNVYNITIWIHATAQLLTGVTTNEFNEVEYNGQNLTLTPSGLLPTDVVYFNKISNDFYNENTTTDKTDLAKCAFNKPSQQYTTVYYWVEREGFELFAGSGDFRIGFVKSPLTVTLKNTNITEYDYTGNEVKPEIVVTYMLQGNQTNMTLALTTDYLVTYTNNINVGTATISVKGCGEYFSELAVGSVTFTIIKSNDPQAPTSIPDVENVVYSDDLTLADVDAPTGFAWTDDTTALSWGENIVQVTYTPSNTNYKTKTDVICKVIVDVEGTISQDSITFTNTAVYDGKEHGIEITNGLLNNDVIYYSDDEIDSSFDFSSEYTQKITETESGEYPIGIQINREHFYPLVISTKLIIKGNSDAILKIKLDLDETYSYTSEEIQPTFNVYWAVDEDENNDILLTEGIDYTYDSEINSYYQNNINAGEATIKVVGIENFCDSSQPGNPIHAIATKNFTINKAIAEDMTTSNFTTGVTFKENLLLSDITPSVPNFTWNNSTQSLSWGLNIVKATYTPDDLANYETCEDVDYQILVEVKGNFVSIVGDESISCTYDNEERTVQVGDSVVENEIVYYSLKENNFNESRITPYTFKNAIHTTVYCKIKMEHYNDVFISVDVNIQPIDEELDFEWNNGNEFDYTGQSITPEFTISYSFQSANGIYKVELVEGVDFTHLDTRLSYYNNNIDSGEAEVAGIGIGNYEGSTFSATFTINKVEEPNYVPLATINVYCEENENLTLYSVDLPNEYEWEDDSISFTFSENILTFNAIYTPINTNYLPKNVEIKIQTISTLLPEITEVSVEGFEGVYSNDLTRTVTVTGTETGDIIKYSLVNNYATASINKPFFKNVIDSTVYIWVEREGYQTLTLSATIIINPIVEDSLLIIIDDNNANNTYYYTGSPIQPAFKVKVNESSQYYLVEGIDYTVDYNTATYYFNNINAGNTPTICVRGIGNYEGSAGELNFEIQKADDPMLSSIPRKIENVVYFEGLTVSDVTPPENCSWTYPRQELTYGSNSVRMTFTPTDSDNYNTVTNLSIIINVILPDIENVTISDYSGTYDGEAHSVIIDGLEDNDRVWYGLVDDKLMANSNQIEYKDVTELITVYVWVERSNHNVYKGSATIEITPCSDADLSISLALNGQDEIPTLEYNGTALEPELVVSSSFEDLILDFDYTVVYSNNMYSSESGMSVEITGIGNYEGSSATTTFYIDRADIEFEQIPNRLTTLTVNYFEGMTLFDISLDNYPDYSWEDSYTEVTIGTNDYNIVYFPVKGTYKQVTGTVEIVANATVLASVVFVLDDYSVAVAYEGYTLNKIYTHNSDYRFKVTLSENRIVAQQNVTYEYGNSSNMKGICDVEYDFDDNMIFCIPGSVCYELKEKEIDTITITVKSSIVSTIKVYTREDANSPYELDRTIKKGIGEYLSLGSDLNLYEGYKLYEGHPDNKKVCINNLLLIKGNVDVYVKETTIPFTVTGYDTENNTLFKVEFYEEYQQINADFIIGSDNTITNYNGSDKVFVGWNSKADLTGTLFTSQYDLSMIGSDMDVYMHLIPFVTVLFENCNYQSFEAKNTSQFASVNNFETFFADSVIKNWQVKDVVNNEYIDINGYINLSDLLPYISNNTITLKANTSPVTAITQNDEILGTWLGSRSGVNTDYVVNIQEDGSIFAFDMQNNYYRIGHIVKMGTSYVAKFEDNLSLEYIQTPTILDNKLFIEVDYCELSKSQEDLSIVILEITDENGNSDLSFALLEKSENRVNLVTEISELGEINLTGKYIYIGKDSDIVRTIDNLTAFNLSNDIEYINIYSQARYFLIISFEQFDDIKIPFTAQDVPSYQLPKVHDTLNSYFLCWWSDEFNSPITSVSMLFDMVIDSMESDTTINSSVTIDLYEIYRDKDVDYSELELITDIESVYHGEFFAMDSGMVDCELVLDADGTGALISEEFYMECIYYYNSQNNKGVLAFEDENSVNKYELFAFKYINDTIFIYVEGVELVYVKNNYTGGLVGKQLVKANYLESDLDIKLVVYESGLAKIEMVGRDFFGIYTPVDSEREGYDYKITLTDRMIMWQNDATITNQWNDNDLPIVGNSPPVVKSMYIAFEEATETMIAYYWVQTYDVDQNLINEFALFEFNVSDLSNLSDIAVESTVGYMFGMYGDYDNENNYYCIYKNFIVVYYYEEDVFIYNPIIEDEENDLLKIVMNNPDYNGENERFIFGEIDHGDPVNIGDENINIYVLSLSMVYPIENDNQAEVILFSLPLGFALQLLPENGRNIGMFIDRMVTHGGEIALDNGDYPIEFCTDGYIKYDHDNDEETPALFGYYRYVIDMEKGAILWCYGLFDDSSSEPAIPNVVVMSATVVFDEYGPEIHIEFDGHIYKLIVIK